uniref:Uncharacterized protein n=1 Tax=viral metagenome TaxID=1070528 RepID=A0A6M3LX46_9ZZZZ
MGKQSEKTGHAALVGGGETALHTHSLPAHASLHEDGGAGEISVEGLSGHLLYEQNSNKILGISVDDEDIGEGRVLVYRSAGPALRYELQALPNHTHIASSGGQLDWDDIWTDAAHSHQAAGEGGQLDHGAALSGLGDDDHPQYLKEEASGGVASEVPDHTHQAAATCGQLDHGLALTGLGDDDHPQYRLESADHTHQSTGMQAGKLDHGLALNGLGDDDHPQYIKDSEYTAKGVLLAGTGSGTFTPLTLGTNTHVLTADSAQGNGVKWATAIPKLNACTAPDGAVNFNQQQATSLVIENRTSDPGSPVNGQIWLRTDL